LQAVINQSITTPNSAILGQSLICVKNQHHLPTLYTSIMKSLIPPIAPLQNFLRPAADVLGLQALPLHVHEIAIAAILYHVIFRYLAPWLSVWLLPNRYRRFTPKEILDWNLQCVSMVQSIVISILAVRYLTNDNTGTSMSPEARVLGYSGAAGSVQAFATGYFLWDLIICVKNFDNIGLPVLIHAISCLIVYSLGFVSLARSNFAHFYCLANNSYEETHIQLLQLGLSPI
jgi:hypothetical protein